MRRIALVAAMALVLAGLAVPANAGTTVYMEPGVGGFMSPNLSYVATIPTDSPGVGARIMTINGQRRIYVSSVQGLRVYDITNPALPLLIGALELPHWENEDVTVSKDGKTILMSEFTGTYMHVISSTDLPTGKLLLQPVGFLPPTENGGHIVDCMDDACNYVYGSEGSIIDLRDKTKPTPLDKGWASQLGLPSNGHNLEVDAAGIAWMDVTPITALNVDNVTKPTVLAQADKNAMGAAKTAYQHNNIRPAAAAWTPRVTAEELADPNYRPGELLLSNGETNFTGTCGADNGPFATYSLKGLNLDGTTKNTAAQNKTFKPIEVFRPINGEYDGNGDPAVNAIGCSGHWFSVNEKVRPGNYTVAAAWYEHGTRLLNVNPATGKISQLGYFQPVAGSASAAHWIDDQYIYVVDYVRGIDILKFDKTKPLPTQDQFDASWLAKVGVVDPASERHRAMCTSARSAAHDAADSAELAVLADRRAL